MTKWGVILSILTSLIAAVLYDLAKKVYPKLKLLYIVETVKRFLRFFIIQNLQRRFVKASIALSIALLVLINVPLPITFAPALHPRRLLVKLVRPRSPVSGTFTGHYTISRDGKSIDVTVDNSP